MLRIDMLTLAIELSTKLNSLAILDNNTVVAEQTWQDVPLRTQHMFDALPRLFEAAGSSIADIESCVVGLGPGSFTGIRVAISAAHGICIPTGKEVYGISSAEIIAYQTTQKTALPNILVLGDARRDMVWHVSFSNEDGFISEQAPIGLTPYNELSSIIQPTTCIVTPDWNRLDRLFQPLHKNDFQLVEESAIPKATSAGLLAIEKKKRNVKSEPLQPVYMHPAVRPKG